MSLEMSVPLPTPEGPTTTKAQGRGAASSDAISTPEDSFWPMGLGIRVATVLPAHQPCRSAESSRARAGMHVRRMRRWECDASPPNARARNEG